MSRIGKQQIEIPEKTEVTIKDGTVVVKGPKGELSKNFRPNILIEIKDKKVILSPKDEAIETMSLWGTYASHIMNMINGVNTPFQKKLIIEGIGYKATLSGSTIVLNIGFSHPVNIKIPAGLNVLIEKNIITVSGIDKEAVGQFTAVIRSRKEPEPYKGKGIRYFDEIIKRKEGKKSV
ncbi:MAG: large subunit ribosomal protein L6 [Parcubacteria group bacterium Athens0714_16]|nr:MAG: large subunit ribosomal protein L6 [Parcubacteria group bacterium Athens0714_16]